MMMMIMVMVSNHTNVIKIKNDDHDGRISKLDLLLRIHRLCFTWNKNYFEHC